MLDPKIVPTGFLKRAKHADTLPTAIGEYIQKVSIKHEDVELVGLWVRETPRIACNPSFALSPGCAIYDALFHS